MLPGGHVLEDPQSSRNQGFGALTRIGKSRDGLRPTRLHTWPPWQRGMGGGRGGAGAALVRLLRDLRREVLGPLSQTDPAGSFGFSVPRDVVLGCRAALAPVMFFLGSVVPVGVACSRAAVRSAHEVPAVY